jgi:hypothetical protein
VIIWPSRHLTDEQIDAAWDAHDEFYSCDRHEEYDEMYDGMTDYLECRFPEVHQMEENVRDAKGQLLRNGYKKCWGATSNLYPSLKFLYEEDKPFAWVQGFLREQSELFVKDEESYIRVQLVTNGYLADKYEAQLISKYGWTLLLETPPNWPEASEWLKTHFNPSVYFVSTNNNRYKPLVGFKYAKDAAGFKLVWC